MTYLTHPRSGANMLLAEVQATLWTVLAALAAPVGLALGWWVKWRRDRDLAELAARRELDLAKLQAQQAQISNVWEQIARMEKHIEFQDTTIAEERRLRAVQDGTIANLQKLLGESQSDRHRLRNENQALAMKLQELTNQNAEQAKQMTVMQQHIGKLEKMVNPPLSAQT